MSFERKMPFLRLGEYQLDLLTSCLVITIPKNSLMQVPRLGPRVIEFTSVDRGDLIIFNVN